MSSFTKQSFLTDEYFYPENEERQRKTTKISSELSTLKSLVTKEINRKFATKI